VVLLLNKDQQSNKPRGSFATCQLCSEDGQRVYDRKSVVYCSATVAKRSFFVINFLLESCIIWVVADGMIGVSFRPLPALLCL